MGDYYYYYFRGSGMYHQWKNYRVQARDIIMSLPNYVLERRGGTKDLSVNCLCISRSLFQKGISFSSYNWDVVSF